MERSEPLTGLLDHNEPQQTSHRGFTLPTPASDGEEETYAGFMDDVKTPTAAHHHLHQGGSVLTRLSKTTEQIYTRLTWRTSLSPVLNVQFCTTCTFLQYLHILPCNVLFDLSVLVDSKWAAGSWWRFALYREACWYIMRHSSLKLQIKLFNFLSDKNKKQTSVI